jgi:DNA-binding response OmpR family regulator
MRQHSGNLLEPHIPAPRAQRPDPGDTGPDSPAADVRTSAESWHILVAESDACEASTLVRGLRRHGHNIDRVVTGAEALEAFQDADLVLLDLEMPDLDGLEVCKKIRSVSDVPLIAVTARSTELDCVLALQAGADDYLIKPYGFRELIARMDAVIRRSRTRAPLPQTISHGELRIDAGTREVRLDSRLIDLTRKEFDLLYHLAAHCDTVVSRKELMRQVWGDTWSRRTVDTHVSSLRSKLGATGWIITVRGVGFRLGGV